MFKLKYIDVINKAIKVINLSKISGNTKKLKQVENDCILKLAKLKGFEKVRYAGFCSTTDNVPKSYLTKLKNLKPAKINKMIDVDEPDLKEILKG